MTVILMLKDTVPIVIGTIIGEDTPMNDLMALKAQVVTANAIEALNHQDQTPILQSNFLHALTTRGAERKMIQQQTSWRRSCSLCLDSAL